MDTRPVPVRIPVLDDLHQRTFTWNAPASGTEQAISVPRMGRLERDLRFADRTGPASTVDRTNFAEGSNHCGSRVPDRGLHASELPSHVSDPTPMTLLFSPRTVVVLPSASHD